MAMSIKVELDLITFSSGREAYANLGVVGLGPNLEIFEGYDGTIEFAPGERLFERTGEHQEHWLTADDLRELADHMIAEWTRYRETLP